MNENFINLVDTPLTLDLFIKKISFIVTKLNE